MACSWKIRHKLMLGMSLVVAVMSLLLGGTLHGLASYRATMGTCESKLEELEKTDVLKEKIRELIKDIPESKQAIELRNRLPIVFDALKSYKDQLQDTIDRGRAPNQGRDEKKFVDVIEQDLKYLKKTIDEIRPSVSGDGQPVSLLHEKSEIRTAIDKTEKDVGDLVGMINRDLSNRIKITRHEARRSIILLITTSILAVLMMTGLLRFFYRWVAHPIHDLEKGVNRVAKGDFEYRIEIQSGDEMEDLAKSYNEMTAKLQAMYENLAQQVNERSRQLIRSERLASVGFLAAGVAHEINNPLAAIAFSSEALESRLDEVLKSSFMKQAEKEAVSKYLKMIQEEAFRCKEITEKLLTFSRGGDRKREETDLADVLQGVLDVVKHLQNSRGKRIDLKANGRLLAWTNGQEVKQVFLNLIVNALESMDEGGVLTVTCSTRDKMAEVAFKDTGCGMTEDVLENIFEPFFTRSRTGKGTGLGLSICHRIITQHGGEIEAASEGPGKGSTFSIRLPTEAPANASESAQEVQDPKEEFLKLSAKRNTRAA